MSANTVRVESRTEDVLNLLAATFSRPTTVLSELLQNARRAGATEVQILTTDGAIEITDDGCGISDFSTLLAVAKSGWDAALQQAEGPYGAGFLSALFACERIEVTSCGNRMAAATNDLLALRPVAMEACDAGNRTTVRLIGHRLGPTSEIQQAIAKITLGFPTPVRLNGKLVERKDAITEGEWIDTEIGRVNRSVIEGRGVSRWYLQGLPISVSARCRDHHGYSWDAAPGVVHLSDELFRGRMPDRESLLNPEAAKVRIEAAVRALATAHLRAELARLDPQAWLTRYATVAVSLEMRDELNAIPFVPSNWVHELAEEPDRGQSDYRTRYRHSDAPIARKRLEQSGLYDFETYNEELSEDDAGAGVYVHATGGFVGCGIPTWHWAHTMMQVIRPDDIRVLPGERIGTDTIDIDGSDVEVSVVASIALQRLSTRDEDADDGATEREPVGAPVPAEMYYDVADNHLYVTRDGSASKAVLQAATFMDDEHFVDRLHEEAASRLRAAREAIVNRDPAVLLKRLIEQGAADCIPGLLRGGEFRVKIDASGALTVDCA